MTSNNTIYINYHITQHENTVSILAIGTNTENNTIFEK